MKDFYQALMASVEALPAEHLLVIKEHPSCPVSYAALHDNNPRIVFANANNTQQLIEGASGVITLNSTVGIESLMLNTPVMTLADACYNIDGLVRHASNQAELASNVADIAHWQVDTELCTAFIGYLADEYLIEGRPGTESPQHFEQFKNHLAGCLNTSGSTHE